MAEFVQTMNDWQRMCKSINNCLYCALRTESGVCIKPSENTWNAGFNDIERVVTAWAAEHPEPVYPTWGEWLEMQDVVGVDGYFETEAGDLPMYRTRRDIWQPIPADIAEKLGIEPKEENYD